MKNGADVLSVVRAADPKWLKRAFNEIGEKESDGGCDNPRIVRYHAFTELGATDDSVPWCASFVCFCLETAGVPSTRSAQARSFLRWGAPLEKPRRGCVVVLSRPGGPSWSGHVGFWVGRVVKNGREFDVILGGNQGDAVNKRLYPVSRVLGYRWPKRVRNSRTMMAVAASGATVAVSGFAPQAATAVDPGQAQDVLGVVSAVLASLSSLPGSVGIIAKALQPVVLAVSGFIIARDRLRKLRKGI